MIKKVFLSSTSDDLEAHRAQVVEELAHLTVFADRMEIFGAQPRKSVPFCRERAASADAVVVIVAHRYGWVPTAAEGGDGEKSITRLEVEAAKPEAVFAYLVDESYPWPWGKESDRLADPGIDPAEVKQAVDRLGELKQHLSGWIRETFTTPEDLALNVVRDLSAWLVGQTAAEPSGPRPLRLQRPEPPPWPQQPYPLLGPYTHPDLFAGRERARDELLRLLRGPQPIVGLHAASGAGKSSLLHAGLLPALSAADVPFALVDHPEEPGVHAKLLGQILDLGDEDLPDPLAGGPPADALRRFHHLLAAARQLSGRPPVLVVDQFEHLFRATGEEAAERQLHARARLGLLLAVTLADFVVGREPLCRWLLVSRSDHHAQVRPWLAGGGEEGGGPVVVAGGPGRLAAAGSQPPPAVVGVGLAGGLAQPAPELAGPLQGGVGVAAGSASSATRGVWRVTALSELGLSPRRTSDRGDAPWLPSRPSFRSLASALFLQPPRPRSSAVATLRETVAPASS